MAAQQTSKQLHAAAKEKARVERRKKAFNAAVRLNLGDTVPGWSLTPDGVQQSMEIKRKDSGTKRVMIRDYTIDQNLVAEKVEEIRKEREEYAAKKAEASSTPEAATNPA